MVITVPFPDSSLMPNRAKGVHWAKLHAARTQAREGAFYLTKLALGWNEPPKGVLPMSVVFCMPDKRKRDIDNLLAACKPQIDGIAHALGVDDSCFKPILVDWVEGSKPGCVVFTLGISISMTAPL